MLYLKISKSMTLSSKKKKFSIDGRTHVPVGLRQSVGGHCEGCSVGNERRNRREDEDRIKEDEREEKRMKRKRKRKKKTGRKEEKR